MIILAMPKKPRVSKTNGGAHIADINDLHDRLVFAAHQALKNEIEGGEIKASTLNSIRQICTDAGVCPSQDSTAQLENMLSVLPTLNIEEVASTLNR